MVLNNEAGQTTSGAEPSIEVDSHGQVYVSAAHDKCPKK